MARRPRIKKIPFFAPVSVPLVSLDCWRTERYSTTACCVEFVLASVLQPARYRHIDRKRAREFGVDATQGRLSIRPQRDDKGWNRIGDSVSKSGPEGTIHHARDSRRINAPPGGVQQRAGRRASSRGARAVPPAPREQGPGVQPTNSLREDRGKRCDSAALDEYE